MVKQRVIVSERDNIAALFEDDRAVEFIINRGDTLLGDVYLSTVENILPSIDAAFVNVGGNKMGFLHASDVEGKGELQKRLKPKQKMVVQVVKEPTGHKGPRVTTNISLPGRFLVFMPDSKGISVSRRIEDPTERARLKAIVSLVKPHGVGVIIRTEAQGQQEADLQEDFEILLDRWQTIVTAADTASNNCLLYRDQDLLYRVIREVVTEDTDEIVVDTAFGQQRGQQLLQTWNMDSSIKVTHYQGAQSILVAMGVEREIKLALQTKVPLPSGGYLYIQPTEALCVVDVNSGKFTSSSSQAETIRLTNLESCKEIARQLRLRNIGGMIIVDFIDMESRTDKLKVLEAFDKELAPDKSKPQMGQLTDLGLVEMTRHRQGQALSEIFSRECPMCQGRGHAIEQFAWAPPNAEAEGRLFGRSNSSSRNPMQRMQQRGKAGGYKSTSVKPGGPAESVLERTDALPPRPQVKPLSEQLPLGAPDRKPLPLKPFRLDLRQLQAYVEQQTLERTGASFGRCVRTTHTPSETNRMLSRINPKAMDVLTLVSDVENGGGSLFAVFEEPTPIENDSYEGYEGETTPETGRALPRDGRMPVMAGAAGYDRSQQHGPQPNQRRSGNTLNEATDGGDAGDDTTQDMASALNGPSRQSLAQRQVPEAAPKPLVPALEAPKAPAVKPSGGLPGLLSSIFRRLPGGHHTEAPPMSPTETDGGSPRMAVLELPGQAPLPASSRSRASQPLVERDLPLSAGEGSEGEVSNEGRPSGGARRNAPNAGPGNSGRTAASSRRGGSVPRYEPPMTGGAPEPASTNAVVRYAELPTDDDDDSADAFEGEGGNEAATVASRSPRSGSSSNSRNRRRPRRPSGGGGTGGGGGRRPPSGPAS
ncbi:MAG: Rne/Rng family ribonuclease [Vampirovibrionales bacterium]|nr:Rne/Rng family ribonuclease [Vampirovibrionales bacterium]